MTGKSKPGMKIRQFIRKKTGNWRHLVTKIFFNILVDSEFNFCNTLETKALKKSWSKEVFEFLQKETRPAFLGNEFLEDNRKLIPEGGQADLDTSIEKLRNKCDSIKKLEEQCWSYKNRLRVRCEERAEVVSNYAFCFDWYEHCHGSPAFQCIRFLISRGESFNRNLRWKEWLGNVRRRKQKCIKGKRIARRKLFSWRLWDRGKSKQKLEVN